MDSASASSLRSRPSLRRSVSASSSSSASAAAPPSAVADDQQEDRRKAVQKVLEQCLRALEVLGEGTDPSSDSPGRESTSLSEEEMEEAEESCNRSSTDAGYETDEVKGFD